MEGAGAHKKSIKRERNSVVRDPTTKILRSKNLNFCLDYNHIYGPRRVRTHVVCVLRSAGLQTGRLVEVLKLDSSVVTRFSEKRVNVTHRARLARSRRGFVH